MKDTNNPKQSRREESKAKLNKRRKSHKTNPSTEITKRILAKSKDVLEDVFSRTSSGLIVTDAKGHIIKTNDIINSMFGYPEGDLQGRHMSILSVQKYAQGSYPLVIGQLFEKGIVENYETSYGRKDGTLLPVEVNIVALKDRDGSFLGAFAAVKDISERKHYESDLKNARNFLEDIFRTAADGILVTDNKGRIIKVNQAIKKLLQYEEDEIIGKFTKDLFPQNEDRRKRALKMMRQLFEDGFIKDWELSCPRKDGSLCTLELNVNIIKDEEGNVKGIVGAARDITKRIQSEQALRKREEQYILVTENIPLHIGAVDETGYFSFWNKYSSKIFGYTEGEALGKITPYVLFASSEEADEAIRMAKKKGKCDREVLLKRKDGTLFPAHLVVVSNKTPEGKITGYFGFVEDISEHKNAEELKKKNELAIKEKNIQLEETNAALKVLLQKREEDRNELEEHVMTNLRLLILPNLERLMEIPLEHQHKEMLKTLNTNLNGITSPFSRTLSLNYLSLTPKEIQLAALIRDGKTTKEIAHLLNKSIRTIDVQRDHIRKKLGIKDRKTNLRTYLLTLK